MEEPIEDILMAHRLRWLGHLKCITKEAVIWRGSEEKAMPWKKEQVARWSKARLASNWGRMMDGMILHRIDPCDENLVMKVLKVSVGRQMIVQPIKLIEIMIIPVRVEGLFEK